jgi:TolB-like protein
MWSLKVEFAMKISILAFLTLFVAGCATESYQPTIRKEIKDVSFQARKEDAAPRKRLMILPFLDSNEARPQSLRDAARDEFIQELNKTGDLIVIDSKDLKVDFSNQLQGDQYKLDEIAKTAKDLGVAALLEGKVVGLFLQIARAMCLI